MTGLTRRNVLLGLAAFSGGAFALEAIAGCRREGEDAPDRGKIVQDITALVIVPSYIDAGAKAKAFEEAAAALRDSPTADTLATARTAWKTARYAWKITDAFFFGPADDLALTGGIIDTAADIAKVEELALAATLLDATAVGRLGANLRGFGGAEVLLFDPAADDTAMLAKFQVEGHRRGLLASLIASDLRSKIGAVTTAWTSPPTDYANQLATAGKGSSIYASERQGVDAIVNALISAAEVLIALRLAKPLGLDATPSVPVPTLVESPRSDVSLDDLLAVLDGIEMVYDSRRGDAQGLALGAAVAERSPSADTKLRSDLPAAKAAVRAVTGPLRTAVTERRDPALAAHAAIREVKRCLLTDVAGALGTSIGFTVTDGD